MKALAKLLARHEAWVNGLPERELPAWIALASAAALFYELAVIRWHAATFQFFSFYKNLSLLSAFLGLGLGYARAERRLLAAAVLPGLLAQWALFALIAAAAPDLASSNPLAADHTMGFAGAVGRGWLGAAALVALVFAANALNALPLGQLCGVLMRRVDRLRAYGWNLLGGLAGILLFLGLSALWTGPGAWFLVLLALLLPLLRSPRPLAWLSVACGLALSAAVSRDAPGLRAYSSPYQSVVVSARSAGNPVAVLRISHFYYQRVLDLSPRADDGSPAFAIASRHYGLPYVFKPRPARVLIVGAGTGNDVAAALRAGAGHVDAVEIDPLILSLGRELHPERPYADPRVAVVVDDARSFLNSSTATYDLVVYGLLDSHTNLSGLSGLRQDSFVYTREGLAAARRRLAPDGLLCLSFAVSEGGAPVVKKMLRLATETFDGRPPLALSTGYDAAIAFVAGPGLAAPGTPRLGPDFAPRIAALPDGVDPATDDWPFPYLARRGVPASHAAIALLLGAVSLLLVRVLRPAGGAETPALAAHFFLLGAAFMLVETRTITELGLWFGNTWQVVAATIAGVLVVAFAANVWVQRAPRLPDALVLALLAASLLLGWSGVLPAGLPRALQPAAALTLAVLPLLFAGVYFSGGLRDARSLNGALTANLFGSICGGFLEYLSLWLGIRALYLVALALYAAAGAAKRASAARRPARGI
jgi:spermidine synthase